MIRHTTLTGTPEALPGPRQPERAAVPKSLTYSRCPDCNSVFEDRFFDEDTQIAYPVDDGEYYCPGCDQIWTDEALSISSFDDEPTGWLKAETSVWGMGK